MKTLLTRMIGAARLKASIYEQVEADPSSMTGAVLVVLASSIAAAVGSGVWDLSGLIGVLFVSLATWAVWVGLTFVIGTWVMPEPNTHATLGELFRTTGFSASPGVLRILGLIPGAALPIAIGITFWMLLTFIVAVRQALDYTGSGRAFAVCFLGWLIYAILFFGFVTVVV